MRILQVTDGIPPATLGGSGQIVWNTAEELAARGHDSYLLTALPPDAMGKGPEGVTLHGIPVLPQRWAHWRSVFSRRRAKEILRVIDEVRPDVIHGHTIAWQTGYRWIREAHARRIPVILTAHDVMHVAHGRVTGQEKALWFTDLKRARWTWNPLRAASIRRTLNDCCRVLCVSDALRRYMETMGFTNLTTVHNGIDSIVWKSVQTQKEARSMLNLPHDRTLFLLAGRLGIDKGTDLIARTLPPDADLILAGSADLDAFGTIRDRIHFFPHQSGEQMRLLYESSDAALVPSRCLDCFPTICLEAHAMERPVLATSWGGARELVKDGVTGWVIDPLDEEAWGARMAWCVANRGELKAMGKVARDSVEKDFSQSAYATRLEEMYGEELTKAGAESGVLRKS